MKHPRRMAFSWLLVILLPTPAICTALLSPIEEHSYDAATFHVYRGVVFSSARAEGILYPRWVQPINAGLGGPLFSFYSPLSYYAMDVLHAVGIPHPVAWRILVALALVVASAGVFVLVLSLFDNATGALAAAALYVYSYPLLREFFERGSPQGFALALYPWALFALVCVVKRPNGLRLGLAALAWAVLILTHNLSAFFLIPVSGLVALLLAYQHGWKALGRAVLVLGSGFLLAGVFLVPFLVERGYVQLDNAIEVDYAQIAENATSLRTLLGIAPPYDVGLDNNLIGDRFGPLQALVALAGLAAGVALWLARRDRKAMMAIGAGLLSLLILWLQTASADPLWRAIPLLSYVQARSRLLGLAVLCNSIAVGYMLSILARRWRAGVALALVAASLFLAVPVLYPQLQYRYATFEQNPTVDDAMAFSMEENVPGLTAFNEFLPIWRYLPFTGEEAQQVASSLVSGLPEGSRTTDESRGTNNWASARVDLAAAGDVDLHTLYFPGWTGTVDGEPHALTPVEGSGYIRLQDLPAGPHSLELRYEGTSAQRAGFWLSAAAALGLLLSAVLWRGKRDRATAASYPAPNGWLVLGLVAFITLKAAFVDGHTTLFRRTSACADVQGADAGVEVRFEHGVRLCAIELQDRVFRPGDAVRITLYWQAERPVTQQADSFVHLWGASVNPKTGNPLWGQQDKQLPGDHPVTKWNPGKIYRDSYEFRIDPDAPPGEYQIEIGWVQPATGQRYALELVQAPDELSVSHLDSLLISGIELR
ncbi:MAG: 6-pyruvoyl-tetrahydropterin synthase-related protein [Anaerolineae bacterium]